MANSELKSETLSLTGAIAINAIGSVAIDASTTVVICGTTGTPTIGRAGVTTSNPGALTVAQALTAQGNLAQSGGTATINATGAVAIDASTTLGICTTAGTPTICRTGVTTTIGGPVALTSTFMTWAEGVVAPLLVQSARTTDATPWAFRISPQAPFATATGTNRTPGSFLVNLSLPTNAGTTEGFLEVQRNTSTQLQLGYTPLSTLLGGVASLIRVPANTDLSIELTGSGRLLLDSTSAAQSFRAGQWLFYSGSTALGLTINPGLASSLVGGATSWTLDAPAIVNLGTGTATTLNIGRTGAGALATVIRAGLTGTITIGDSTAANTVAIANGAVVGIQTVNLCTTNNANAATDYRVISIGTGTGGGAAAWANRATQNQVIIGKPQVSTGYANVQIRGDFIQVGSAVTDALGFYGATPLARATADGTLGNLITILRDRGLIG